MLGVESTLVSRRKVPNVSYDRQWSRSGRERGEFISPLNIMNG